MNKIINALNYINILFSFVITIWGCDMLTRYHDVFNTPNFCPDDYKNIYIYLWLSVGIAILGSIYKLSYLKCNNKLFIVFNVLNIGILSYNTYILTELNSSCKTFYREEYKNIWILFIAFLIYQIITLFVGIINLINYIVDVIDCGKSDSYYY